jgi:hypothetical protein
MPNGGKTNKEEEYEDVDLNRKTRKTRATPK